MLFVIPEGKSARFDDICLSTSSPGSSTIPIHSVIDSIKNPLDSNISCLGVKEVIFDEFRKDTGKVIIDFISKEE